MRLIVLVVVCLLVSVREVHSKAAGVPANLEDIYGDLNGAEDVQNDETNYEDYALPEGDGDAPDNPSEPSEEPPVILTKPLELIVAIGDIVVLPCQISSKFAVTMWKKQTNSSGKATVLYQSGTPLTKFENINLLKNNSLEVHVMSDEDLGSYMCQVAWSETIVPEVVHKVYKAEPPTIVALEANSRTLRVGERLTLHCNASGHPEPTISWHKNDMRLTIKEPILEVPDIKFEDRGIYRCLADNKHGHPAHAHIEIFVFHKPVVAVEKFLVSSDKEHDAELHCTVHAYPAPVVYWQKDGMNIGEAPPRITLSRRHNNEENVLIIRELQDSDFGTYTCAAKNGDGSDQKNVTLVRTPAIREFQKPEKGSRDVVLTWKVESKSPIVEHELQYRKKGEMKWNVIKPEVTNGSNGIYEIQYTLKGLEPGTYETRARSQNSHGWSDFSEVMPFEGVLAKHGDHYKPKNKKHKHTQNTESRNVPAQQQQPEEAPKETAVGASQTSGCNVATSSISIFAASLMILTLIRQ